MAGSRGRCGLAIMSIPRSSPYRGRRQQEPLIRDVSIRPGRCLKLCCVPSPPDTKPWAVFYKAVLLPSPSSPVPLRTWRSLPPPCSAGLEPPSCGQPAHLQPFHMTRACASHVLQPMELFSPMVGADSSPIPAALAFLTSGCWALRVFSQRIYSLL